MNVDWGLIRSAIVAGVAALFAAILVSWMIGPLDTLAISWLAMGATVGYVMGRNDAPYFR